MGRLTDTKVRGFMVTETNNDACAQLQPVLAHAASLTLQPSPPERLAPSCWAVGLFLSIAIKLNSGRMNLRSASKSTPDPPDACSKERAQTFMTEQGIGGNCQGPDQDPFLPSIIPCLMMCVESGLKRDRQRALC